MALYGSSAGAAVAFQLLLRLKAADGTLPVRCGAFSIPADLSDFGDSGRLFTMLGLAGPRPALPGDALSEVGAYLASVDPTAPEVSPVYADLRGMPPTLLVSGTRDLLLSPTTRLHRRLLSHGVRAELIVFEAMHHCHWFDHSLPEALEFLEIAGRFLVAREPFPDPA